MRLQLIHKRSRRRSHHGNVAIITALTILMLCGFAAIAVDVGNMYRVRSQERNALDAAALAAAGQLDGTTNGWDRARAAAIAQARLHRVNRTNLELTAGEIVFGRWDPPPSPANPDVDYFVAGGTADLTNAVRIDHTTEPIRHPFGGVIGTPAGPIRAAATAVGGGPGQAPCAFPLVVSECALRQATAGNNCGYMMQMQNSTSDTAGWTTFNAGSVGGPAIRNVLAASCATITDGMCGPTCSNQLDRNATIRVNNGNLMNNGNNNFCPLIRDLLQRNGSPQSFSVTVPVMRTGPMQPCNPDFADKDATIEGFAELTIFGVRCANSGPAVIAPNPDPSMTYTTPPSGSYVLAALNCNTRINRPATVPTFWGTTGRPRLVR